MLTPSGGEMRRVTSDFNPHGGSVQLLPLVPLPTLRPLQDSEKQMFAFAVWVSDYSSLITCSKLEAIATSFLVLIVAVDSLGIRCLWIYSILVTVNWGQQDMCYINLSLSDCDPKSRADLWNKYYSLLDIGKFSFCPWNSHIWMEFGKEWTYDRSHWYSCVYLSSVWKLCID